MATLSVGAEVQLGAAPNPFSPALVRVTGDAVAHLDEALAVIERQIPLVDPNLAHDLELWKLATLLINPARTRQSRAFADEMMRRDSPIRSQWRGA